MNLLNNLSLKPYNTFGIDATARFFSAFSSLDELKGLLVFQAQQKLQRLVLGGGSNVLFIKDVDGIVLKNELKGIKLVKEDDRHYYVKAAAGENWHRFVMHCIENNYAGIENLSLIPGNVGASPMQNIGAYGVEIKDVFESLEALHAESHSIQTFSADDCAFGYRESVFKKQYRNRYIILGVTFRLNKQPVFNTAYGAIEQELEKMNITQLSIQAISQAVINIRSSKLPDPAKTGNAGSFFKNPVIAVAHYEILKQANPAMPHFAVDEGHVKIPAAWLIEQCGWKGFREGDAGVHIHQPLVLVNYGGATGDGIYALSEKIISSVKNRFGIELEREVNIISI
ncbi:UDP-N-acetylmuramate dehydrogenase [Parafilimonas sp.]|uniref:UDP-N-acetylmuramate dehydrogenase n=1 Tax=Parafilimonas sp. TaxID=1969739 RepID=UPI0039E26A24